MLHQVKIGEKKIFMYYVRAVVMDDQKTKEKMKKYADKSRKTSDHEIYEVEVLALSASEKKEQIQYTF